MKLRNPLAKRQRQEVVRQFGDAMLVRNRNGQHELIGGTNAGREPISNMRYVFMGTCVIMFTNTSDATVRHNVRQVLNVSVFQMPL